MTYLRFDECPANEVCESFMGIAPILLLRTMPTRDEQYAAIVVETLTCQRPHPGFHALIEGLRPGEIEAQLHGGGDLVDVLAAGTGSADETQFEVGVGDLDLS